MNMQHTTTDTHGDVWSCEFHVSPDINYVRRTGDYSMEFATLEDWHIDIYDVLFNNQPTAQDPPSEVQQALLNFWKDSYDPTP